MKTLRLLALLVAAAMFLVACGTGNGNGNGDDDPVVTTGTLFVNVNVPATVTVLDSDGVQVDQRTNVSATNWTVEAGSYTVQAAAAGYGAQSEPVTITAEQSSSVNFSLVADTVVLGNVANVEVVRFFDEAGNDYDTNDEINPVKDAILVAAQTEELVGIEIKVTDEDGLAIQGAPVTLSVTGLNLIVAVYSGKPTDIQTSAATFDGVVTDAQGMAYFTLEATYALDSLNDYLEDGLYINQEPAVKVLVSSVGGDNIVKRTEFKAYFVNMSHLWYWGSPYRAGKDKAPINLEYAEERLGGVVGPFTNIWTIGTTNRHEFNTVALVKQPTSGPHDVGSYHGSVVDDLFDGLFPGYVRYEIIDVSEDADGNPLIVWEDWATNCNWMNRKAADLDPLVCESGAGPVALLPVAGLGLEDLPVSATVKATYVFVAEYGEQVATGTPNRYEFELKDYTFTKTWIGGYLEVDKFVDQHVLTWAGEGVTLAPSAVTYEEVYTSKVHVVVSNPSGSTMYNVSVRDVVPAELGVVTGSISDGGTYDPFNHAVTWNNVPALDALAPGDDPIVLTFDVYARHKPGYCWTPDAIRGDVPPLLPPAVEQQCDPYDDPYAVTNGAAYTDFSGNFNLGVSAAAQFVDDETQPQVVFYYEPFEDESTIWVVRPLFAIEKNLVSPDVMDVGATAIFEIEVRQIDRVSKIVDPLSTEYAFLYDRYPWEFTGTLLEDEDFHAADRDEDGNHEIIDGPTVAVDGSDVRDNPYARNVAVTDAFDYGLDFTSGLDFNDTLIVPGSTKVVGKTVSFDAIPWLSRGKPQTAIIRLTGQLVSDDLSLAPDGFSQNGAIAQLGDDEGLYAWQNCAYLFAPQLNQPFPANPVFGDTIYALWDFGYPTQFGTSNLWLPTFFEIDGEYWFGTELVPSFTVPPFVPNGTTPWPITAAGRIESCDEVAVVPLPPLPFLGINVDGEHETVTFNDVTGELILDGRRDVFVVGETFYYVYSVENSGGGIALNVDIEITRTNARTAFVGSPAVYTTTSPRTLVSVYAERNEGVHYDLTLDTAAAKHLTVPEMQPNEVIVIVIAASANQVGGQTITLQVPSYDNPPVYQDFAFLISTDSTSVAP